MFTGIVQATTPVAWVEHTSHLMRYALHFPSPLLSSLKIGASVSIHGVCQTVVAIQDNIVIFDAIEETLKCTTLGTLQAQQLVNIERSAKLGDEVGGHLLSGHIIGMGQISKLMDKGEQRILTIDCNPQWSKYLFPKGYIALNGASLTLVDCNLEFEFSVHLIPATLDLTTFSQVQVGDWVNIEIDHQTQVVVDTIERLIQKELFKRNQT